MVMAADGGAANRLGGVGGWARPELGEEKRDRREEEGGGRSRERIGGQNSMGIREKNPMRPGLFSHQDRPT
jgi:hypothetical protein